ncbi:fluoride efflux transporter FluC [Bryobacter aggregatus]|uniref:fluoride efflux transporter FluC n=1 Tax=Bryobacter aggregatus TaxID=360054 RepID=UPI0004E13D6A|nr:CrcB family protein [Bryobacter aggregatus]
MIKYGLIGLGAACGGMARFAIATSLPLPFPWQTFVINFTGGALIGFLANRLQGDSRYFWITGICGGYTTFSTFSIEVVTLLEQGRYALAASYIFISVALCVAAAAATYHWTK